MIEQLDYPSRGNRGINFRQVIYGRGALVSESGRSIRSEVSDSEIYLEDEGFSMEAILDDDFLRFTLYTKNRHTGKRHPDFFAAKFVGLAINHFESKGLPVERVRDIWPAWSDNYRMFMTEFDQSRDKIRAAQATWSHGVYQNLGFRLNEERVIVNEYTNFPDGNNVIAYFDRI